MVKRKRIATLSSKSSREDNCLGDSQFNTGQEEQGKLVVKAYQSVCQKRTTLSYI
jgi:hypothetical protein